MTLKIIPYEGNIGADYDVLIETACSECFVRVVGLKVSPTAPAGFEGEVFVSTFSMHVMAENQRMASRFRRSWNMLTGRNATDELALETLEDTQNLIKALQECSQIVYSKPVRPKFWRRLLRRN